MKLNIKGHKLRTLNSCILEQHFRMRIHDSHVGGLLVLLAIICGRCITEEEVLIAYPLSRGIYLKK